MKRILVILMFYSAVTAIAFTGCGGSDSGGGFIEYIGTAGSLGDNATVMNLITAINNIRADHGLGTLVESTEATTACQEYVEGTANCSYVDNGDTAPEVGEYPHSMGDDVTKEVELDPYYVIKHCNLCGPNNVDNSGATSTGDGIGVAVSPVSGDALHDALTAMNYGDPEEVVAAWNATKDQSILLNADYNRIGVGLADPKARWAVYIFRPAN